MWVLVQLHVLFNPLRFGTMPAGEKGVGLFKAGLYHFLN